MIFTNLYQYSSFLCNLCIFLLSCNFSLFFYSHYIHHPNLNTLPPPLLFLSLTPVCQRCTTSTYGRTPSRQQRNRNNKIFFSWERNTDYRRSLWIGEATCWQVRSTIILFACLSVCLVCWCCLYDLLSPWFDSYFCFFLSLYLPRIIVLPLTRLPIKSNIFLIFVFRIARLESQLATSKKRELAAQDSLDVAVREMEKGNEVNKNEHRNKCSDSNEKSF